MSLIRCIIADSQTLSREGLRALLQTRAQFRVVGCAASVHEAAALCRRELPDVLILDSHLAASGKASAIESVVAAVPEIQVLVLVQPAGQRCEAAHVEHDGILDDGRFPCCSPRDCVGRALAEGARGVLLRSASEACFFRAVATVAARRPWFEPDTVQRLADCLLNLHDVDASLVLSARERQVAELVSEGCCNKEIGDRLNIEVSTVKKHVGHILTKLELRDRLQVGLLVSRAQRLRGEHSA